MTVEAGTAASLGDDGRTTAARAAAEGSSSRSPGSLGRRLVASAIASSTIILVVAGLILSAIYRTGAESAFDDQLTVYLKGLVADVASPVEGERADPGQLGEPRFELPSSGWYWQIAPGSETNAEFRTSRSLFGARLASLERSGGARIGEVVRGYVTGPEGRRLRVVERTIDLGDDGRFQISVAGPADELSSRVREFNLAVLATFLLLGVALVAATFLQVRYGLAPLKRLRAAIAAIRAGEAERVDGRYPADLAPLAGELNLLIESNRDILERARTQVGNLAHALKTPLSVIRNEASGPEPVAVKVREQAAIMGDQITWYLDRARAAARTQAIGAVAEVQPVVEGLLRAFRRINASRGIAFEADVDEGARFRGERQDLEELVGNLLDNAGKWATSAVEFRVAADRTAARLVLTVDDDGPGMPAAHRAEAPKRGRRLDETTPGTGLGLSIVAELAALYGGALALEASPLGGLRARLELPAV